MRQVIESGNETFKSQLDLEQYRGHTPGGAIARVTQRIPAMTAVIWPTVHPGQPIRRSLTPYDRCPLGINHLGGPASPPTAGQQDRLRPAWPETRTAPSSRTWDRPAPVRARTSVDSGPHRVRCRSKKFSANCGTNTSAGLPASSVPSSKGSSDGPPAAATCDHASAHTTALAPGKHLPNQVSAPRQHHWQSHGIGFDHSNAGENIGSTGFGKPTRSGSVDDVRHGRGGR